MPHDLDPKPPLAARALFPALLGAVLGWLGAAAAGGCGPSTAADPFALDGGGAGNLLLDTGVGGSAPEDAAPDADPTLGGPCVDDGQCNDGLACTLDACDPALKRCRFSPDDSQCQNTTYCDGLERCDQKLGCRAGEPVSCSDKDPCTLDACEEAKKSCAHAPRDADGDGDPDVHCPPTGHDCDDTDPDVSSKHPEVCANGKDDNCNGVIDEMPCSTASHDTCLAPLEIDASGTYAMSTVACALDYASLCAPAGPPPPVDAVAAIVLPAGPPIDVEVTARTQQASVAVTLAGQCGDPNSLIVCGSSFPSLQGGTVARLRGRGLGDPAMKLALPIYVTTSPPSPVTLEVKYLPAAPKPTNETCGTAQPLVPGVPLTIELVDAATDLGSACSAATGDLVYSFTLAAPSNVNVFGSSIDGDGLAVLSLRGPGCALPADEIACTANVDGHLFWQALPAGTYYVSVAATAPTTLSLTVELSAPSPPGADENCSGSPVLQPGKTLALNLAGHQDDVSLGCIQGAVDAAYELDLAKTSDVLLVERVAAGDQGGIELAQPACAGPQDLLACGTAAQSPLRAAKHGVAAGSYRVVAESLEAKPVQITAFVRDAVAPALVPFADACADALTIPKTGGFFQGTTGNAAADFSAGCDFGGVPPGGAPDQLLKLVLDASKRVVLDMSGSTYTTLLDVRVGPGCPGTEVPLGCAVGYSQQRSFLDLTLSAGTYYVQIDGFDLDKGAWFLDVRVVDP